MRRRLTYDEAIVVWIGRWLGISTRKLAQRFDVDARRLYEIWMLEKHARSFNEAERIFRALFPNRIATTSFTAHRKRHRWSIPGQLDLFLEPSDRSDP